MSSTLVASTTSTLPIASLQEPHPQIYLFKEEGFLNSQHHAIPHQSRNLARTTPRNIQSVKQLRVQFQREPKSEAGNDPELPTDPIARSESESPRSLLHRCVESRAKTMRAKVGKTGTFALKLNRYGRTLKAPKPKAFGVGDARIAWSWAPRCSSRPPARDCLLVCKHQLHGGMRFLGRTGSRLTHHSLREVPAS